MRQYRVIVVCCALAMVQAGCIFFDTEHSGSRTVAGSQLDSELQRAYGALAEQSLEDGHRLRASFFAVKSRAAGSGQHVHPETLEDWLLPVTSSNELAAARHRLVHAISESERARAAKLAARAQTRFDCWLQAAASPAGETLAEHCRGEFLESIDALTQALAVN